MPCHDQPDIRKLYGAVEFISYVKTRHYQGWESVSDSISVIEAPALMWLVHVATGDVFIIITIIIIITRRLTTS